MSEAVADSLFSWLDAAGNVNTLDVDVVMATSDKRQAQLTDHVVETGAVVTDHIVIRPEQLSFELVVTQTPMGGPGMAPALMSLDVETGSLVGAQVDIAIRKSQFQPGGFLALTSGLRSAVSGLLGSDSTPSQMRGSRTQSTSRTLQVRALQSTAGPVERVNAAHSTLVDEIMNQGLLVTISFKGRLYVDYLLTSVELSQGKGEAGMGRFKVEARAFRAVSGVNVDLPDPEDFRTLPKQTKGNQPVKTPDPDPKKRGKSAAKNVDALTKPARANIGKLLGVP